MEGLPLYDSDDIEVLMHRHAHFGGSFGIMLDYYEKGGKGAVLEIERVQAHCGYTLRPTHFPKLIRLA